jgi:hypothetical protein
MGSPTEQIGGLALAFVTPLGADQDDCRHRVFSCLSWCSRHGLENSRSITIASLD